MTTPSILTFFSSGQKRQFTGKESSNKRIKVQDSIQSAEHTQISESLGKPLNSERYSFKEMKDGGTLEYYEKFMSKDEADALYELCKVGSNSQSVKWEEEHIILYGKRIKAPRLTALIGEKKNLTYKYAGVTKVSSVWPDLVEALKHRIEKACGHEFNVALLNWYKDGDDYMGWHSDNESDIIPGTKIASISLGMTREFQLKHKTLKTVPKNHEESDLYTSVDLKHGDLLIMGGTLQKYWKHSLPKLSKSKIAFSTPRINFTFRLVKSDLLKEAP